MRRVHVVVHGEVQGVGFRWFTRECAQRHGVDGWVRNRANGDVEIMAGGDVPAIDAFLSDVRRGPPRAGVRDLHIRDETGDGVLPHPFEIQR